MSRTRFELNTSQIQVWTVPAALTSSVQCYPLGDLSVYLSKLQTRIALRFLSVYLSKLQTRIALRFQLPRHEDVLGVELDGINWPASRFGHFFPGKESSVPIGNEAG
jgi:hypothetical protein